MLRLSRRSMLRGGLYHAGLLFITATAFNLGFQMLTGVNIAQRVFAGVQMPTMIIAVALCAAAVVVLWNNWVD